MAAADYSSVVQQLYVAYFGRPADPVGLANFEAQLNAIGAPTTMAGLSAAYGTNSTVKALVDQFGTSAESAALYTGSTVSFVNAIYQNVLNRDADLEGLLFWAGAIDNGSLSRGKAAMSIMAGAQANTSAQGLIDAAVVANKTTVAANFTTALDLASEVIAYSGDAAASTVRAMLQQVTSTTDTTAFQTTVNSTVTTVVNNAASYGGTTYTLTTAADIVPGTSSNDTIVGTLPFKSDGTQDATATLTAGDQITGGGGTDTLKVTISGSTTATATAATPSLTSVERVQINNVSTDTGHVVALDLSLADTALTSVGTSGSSTAGVATKITNVGKLAAIEMAGRGDLNVNFATGVTTGSSDAESITLNGVGTSATTQSTLTLNTNGGAGAVETLNVTSATSSNYVTITDSGVKTINIAGAKDIVATVGGNASLTNVNASTATGAVTVDIGTLTLASTTVTGGTGSNDTFVTGNDITAVTDLKNVTGFETVKETKTGGAVTLAAAVTGVSTFDFSTNTAQTLTLNTGYTGATTVKLTGDGGAHDVINNNANVALTVVGNVVDFNTTTIAGGTGTDVLKMTANSDTASLANVTGVETITILANSTDSTKTATLNNVNTAATKTVTVDASALNDGTATLNFTAGTDSGHLVITGGAGKDTIQGGNGGDTINAGAGNDSITAGTGNDSINAGDGNDAIVMNGNLTSADTIDGGSGTDTLSVTSVSDASAFANVTNVEVVKITGAGTTTLAAPISTSATFDLTTATAQTLTLASGYTGATTVKLTGDGGAHDVITNSANVALTVAGNVLDFNTTTIAGGTGTDVLQMTANSDAASLANVTGVETITILANATDATKTATLTNVNTAATKTVTVDASALTSSSATLNFSAGTDSGHLVVTGGAGADTIAAGNGGDTINGGAGNDSITAGGGNDFLNGGDGNDTINMGTNLTFDDTIDGGSGTDTLVIANTGGTFGNNGELAHVSNVEALKFTGASETVNTGSSFAGFTTFDLTDSGATALTLAAGYTAASGATVKLAGDGGAHDSITNTAAVALTVTGNATDFTGTTIAGGSGTDTLTITADNGIANLANTTGIENVNIAAGSTASNTVNVTLGAAGVIATGKVMTVNASALTDSGATFSFNGSAITGTGAVSLTGGAGSDLIVTGAGADVINGGAGNDFINSGAGLDTITGGAGNDLFQVNGNANKLTFATVTDATTGDAVYFTGLNDGGSISTTIPTKLSLNSAATLSDYIDAAAAGSGGTNAVLSWFQYGGNTYVVADDNNGTSFTAGTGAHTDKIIQLQGLVDLSTSTITNTASSGNVTWTIGSQATGTAAGVIGTAFTQGAAANASWTGTAGNDVFTFNSFLDASDTVASGGGTDTLKFTDANGAATDMNNITGASNWNIVLGNTTTNVNVIVQDNFTSSTGTSSVTGASLTTGTMTWDASNESTAKWSITGGAAADTLTGGAGADTINGGAGADVIKGGAGADVIDVGNDTAADKVTLSDKATVDTISNFHLLTNATQEDILQVSVGGIALLKAGDAGAGTGSVGAGDSAVFQSINAAGAVTTTANNNVLVFNNAAFDSAAHIQTAIQTGGGTVITFANANATGDFLAIYDAGANVNIAVVHVTTAATTAAATVTDIATLVGVSDLSGLNTADLAFIA